MEEARSDSVGAPWLPLCVYAGLLPAGTMDALRAQAPAGAGGAAGAAAAAGPAAAAAAAAPAGRGSGSTAGDGADAARQLRALQAQGWQPLRHGVQAPYQQAHWSDYYLTHARNPEIITLAPWVRSRWWRRAEPAAAPAVQRLARPCCSVQPLWPACPRRLHLMNQRPPLACSQVADRWVRRRARAAARRGGSGSDSSDSGTDPDTE